MVTVRTVPPARATSLIPDEKPAALHLTADHQQPRHYTPYVVTTQVYSPAPDDGHTSARNMLGGL
jgi:hypothetical protein